MITPSSAKIIALAVLVIACVAFFGLWRYEVKDHKITQEALKTAQAVIAAHEENAKISERTNHAHQNALDRLSADVKRLRAKPARCIPVARPSGLHPEKGSGGGYAAQDGQGAGIASEFLYDFAADCEHIRIERNGCKDFVNSVYDARQGGK